MWYGVVGATTIIVITTLDDCVWLVPLIVQCPNRLWALLHACTFVLTFVTLTSTICLITEYLQRRFLVILAHDEWLLTLLSASFCWILALYFYCRSIIKNRRRQQQQQQPPAQQPVVKHEQLLSIQHSPQQKEHHALTVPVYGSITYLNQDEQQNQLSNHMQQESIIPLLDENVCTSSTTTTSTTTAAMVDRCRPQLCLVLSLTVIGSLDEVSYFPGLIAGKVFTVQDLILGSIVAALCMVLVVVLLLPICTSCLQCLDRIPLYAIVALFALYLSIDLLWSVSFFGI
jgi:hypothetical protein